MNRLTLVGITVCYAFALTASAQGPPPQLDPDSFGVIEGTVIDQRGKPVDGAFVYSGGKVQGELPLRNRWPPGPPLFLIIRLEFMLPKRPTTSQTTALRARFCGQT